VIPPVLDLVNKAYGFAGAPGASAHALGPRPQAGLISALGQAVIQNDPEKWQLMGWGALIGAAIITLDWLAVEGPPAPCDCRHSPSALGIYLPTASTLMVTVGRAGSVGGLTEAPTGPPKPQATKQLGVLLASGLIVGEERARGDLHGPGRLHQ